jgi:uncharacterized protein (TIRG00374 family)
MVRSLVSLVVSGVALYVFLPTALSEWSSWRTLRGLDWRFAVLALVLEVGSWVWVWQLDRIAVGESRWFVVACSVSAGNALGRVVPGTATPESVRLLGDAGVDEGTAAAGLATSTLLQVGTALALPLLALPGILAGAPVAHGLLTALAVGIIALVVLVIVGAVTLESDGLLRGVGGVIEWTLNHTVDRRHPISGVSRELLDDRDAIRSTLRTRWRAALTSAAANTLFDYAALLAALRAVHADPRPSLVVLAYTAAEVLSQVPFTPGGLGFVEAGLAGTLTLAGVPASEAVAATLLYRLVSYWLPIPVGGVGYLLFRRRYPAGEAPAGPTA